MILAGETERPPLGFEEDAIQLLSPHTPAWHHRLSCSARKAAWAALSAALLATGLVSGLLLIQRGAGLHGKPAATSQALSGEFGLLQQAELNWPQQGLTATSAAAPEGLPECAPEGADPFADHDPASNKYTTFCCPGTFQKLGSWNGPGPKTYRCMRSGPAPDWGSLIQAGPPQPGQVRFLNLNTFWKNHRYDLLASLIAHIDPDIAALEEIPSWQRRDGLLDSLRRFGKPFEWASTPDKPVNYDGHILYRTDKWQVLESDVLLVDQRARSPGILRGVHWAAMQRKADGVRILVYGAHPSYDRRKPTFLPRDWPAMDLVKKTAPLMRTLGTKWNAPAVFMCDCNTGDSQPSMQWLKSGGGGLRFSTAATGDIDHIYFETSPKLLGQASNPRVVSPERVGVRRPEWGMSDHPPVFVDIALTGA